MATSLPGAQTKVNLDNINDNAPAGLAEIAANVDRANELRAALGAAALLNVGDGLTTGSQPSGTPNDLKLNISSSFEFVGGLLSSNDFLTIESDEDDPQDNPPPDFNLRRAKTGIADGDTLGAIKFRGSNAAAKANNIIYAEINADVKNPAAGSEDGQLKVKTIRNGVQANRFKIRDGMLAVVSGADVSGGDKGPGTSNWQDVYRRGALMPFQEAYDSGEQTITAAAQLILAHGLTRTPTDLRASLICKTAEQGYSVNDEVPIDMHSSLGDGSGHGFMAVVDAISACSGTSVTGSEPSSEDFSQTLIDLTVRGQRLEPTVSGSAQGLISSICQSRRSPGLKQQTHRSPKRSQARPALPN